MVGIGMVIYGTVLSTYAPFREWKYKREKGVVNSSPPEYAEALRNMTIAGSRAAVTGLFLTLLMLAMSGILGK